MRIVNSVRRIENGKYHLRHSSERLRARPSANNHIATAELSMIFSAALSHPFSETLLGANALSMRISMRTPQNRAIEVRSSSRMSINAENLGRSWNWLVCLSGCTISYPGYPLRSCFEDFTRFHITLYVIYCSALFEFFSGSIKLGPVSYFLLQHSGCISWGHDQNTHGDDFAEDRVQVPEFEVSCVSVAHDAKALSGEQQTQAGNMKEL